MSSRVSVVMGVYNAERFLTETVKSVLSQTFSDFEFIIVNDGSMDNTEDMLNVYAKEDRRINVIKQKNKGLTAALNNGIRASSGEYIVRIDAGDIALPERLFKQIIFMDNNPAIGLSGTWYDLINEEGGFIKRVESPQRLTDIKKALMKSAPIIHSSFMMRREVLERVGYYDENFKFAQDRDLIFRVLKYSQVGIFPEKLVKLRVAKGSTTFVHESAQKKFCAKAISRAVSGGLYPKWSYIFALRYVLSAIIPSPVREIKNTIARFIGKRHDGGNE
jgi:glycosyltransferase involved in cell wall biosynthesis